MTVTVGTMASKEDMKNAISEAVGPVQNSLLVVEQRLTNSEVRIEVKVKVKVPIEPAKARSASGHGRLVKLCTVRFI